MADRREPLLSFDNAIPRETSSAALAKKLLAAVLVTVSAVVLVGTLIVTLRSGNAQTRVHTFLHMTDFHFDSTNRTCECDPSKGFERCCRSKGPYGPDTCAYSPWGQYGSFGCDSPKALIDAAFDYIADLKDEPNFVMICGDLSGHNSPDHKTTLFEVTQTHEQIINSLPADMPVIGVIGNDDVFEDYCVDSVWLQQLSSVWASSINCKNCFKSDPNNTNTFLAGGYYATWPVEGLKVIALNTLYLTERYQSNCTHTGPQVYKAQWQWLEAQLEAAQDSGDAVYIFGHVAPGPNVFFKIPGHVASIPLWQIGLVSEYAAIIDKYSSVVQGQFFAHTHRDDFRLLPDASNTPGVPGSVAFITPSISPVYNNNPGFRRYFYSKPTFGLENYELHYFDLQGNNLGLVEGFQPLYDFASTYAPLTSNVNPAMGLGAMQQVHTSLINSLQNLSTYLSYRNVLFQQQRFSWSCMTGDAGFYDFAACVEKYDEPKSWE